MKTTLQAAKEKVVRLLKKELKTIAAEERDLLVKLNGVQDRRTKITQELEQFDSNPAEPTPARKIRKAATKKGRKPAAVKATATKAKKTSKKAATKKAKKAPKKAATKKKTAKKAPKKTAAAKGRRAVADGLRPPLKEAIATVMGKKTMGATKIIESLKERGWMPDARDERGYIHYALSSNKTVFERVGRGQYKVRSGVTFKRRAAKASTATIKKATTPAKKAPKMAAAPATPPKPMSEEDKDVLKSIGVGEDNNVQPNPFGG